LLARLLRSLAEERPVLWVVEDLHFADPASRRGVAALARAAAGRRALLVVTTRPGLDAETRASLSSLPGYGELVLERLGAPALGALVGQRVAEPGLARRLAWLLAPRTDGIPYFVLETLRDFERRGHLVRGADGLLHEGTPIAEAGPPRALQDLVRARLAALAPADRGWLDLAAVEGYEFDPGVLARARGRPRLEVLESLGRLERGYGLVRGGARSTVFDCHALHEVLYGDLPAPLRAGLHDLLAAALEGAAAAGGVAGETAVRATRHRLRGADPTAARPSFPSAYAHLQATSRPGEQLEIARAALNTPGLFQGPERFSLALQAAKLARDLGRRRDVAELLGEAMRLATAAGNEEWLGRVEVQRGFEALATATFDEALALGRSAAARFERLGDSVHRVEALRIEGKAHWLLGRSEDARRCHERTMTLAATLPSPTPHARIAADLAIVLQEIGHLAEAEALQRRSVAVLLAHGEQQNYLACLTDLANTLVTQGRVADALATYREVIAESERLGWAEDLAVEWVNVAEASMRMGNLPEARQAGSTALDLARTTGKRRVEGYALHNLAMVAAWSGDRTGARRLFEEAERLRRAIGNRAALLETLLQLAGIAAEEGEPERATVLLEEAARLAAAVNDPNGAALIALHGAALPGADLPGGRAAFEAAEPRLRLDVRLEGRWLLWRLSRSETDLAAARAVLAEQRRLLPADTYARFLEHVPYARELAAGVVAGRTD
jgi:tetratricopeptide (TPR) repeat protein